MSSDFSKIDKIKIDVNQKEDLSDTAKNVFTPDEQRRESEKKHIHKLTIILLWGIVFSACIIGLVVVLHLVFPECLRWLSKEEVMNLKSIFVSGVGGAILAKFGNKLTEK